MEKTLSKKNNGPEGKGRAFPKLTPVSIMHYVKLVYRSLILLTCIGLYIYGKIKGVESLISPIKNNHPITYVVLGVYVVEMLLRFFPSKLESPGCQKQFARNYIKSGNVNIVIQDNNAVMLVAMIWIAFNFVFGALYMFGILDEGIMLLLACAYAVCDLICILFFCPFQTWFLKNKCCSACRIYNWDYAMMFTPLIFIRSIPAWILIGLSIILLARWEITFFRHPERFAESTNDYLKCANCTEKLCTHKKQLKFLWASTKELTAERIKKLRK